MFDLEQAITQWRQQMLAAGIQSPVPLEELEGHLREEIERQIELGIDERLAFEHAVRQMGPAGALKDEFKPACGRRWKPASSGHLLRLGGIGLGITVITNLLGRYEFHRSSSVLFSHGWWSAWLSNYIIWMNFVIIGAFKKLAERRAQRKAAGK